MKLPMFDDYWIDFRKNTTRRWFQPEHFAYVPGGAYSSLIYDDSVKKYRVYYETCVSIDDDDARVLRMEESEDLIHFTPYENENGDNTVCDGWFGLHGCSVLYDKFDKNPDRRYKLCGMFNTSASRRDGTDPGWMGVEIAFSPDGIHFTRHPECKVCEITSDSLNKLVYNATTGEYMVFHRAAFVDRRVNITISKDLVHWSEPRVILTPGTHYNNGYTGMQHYALTGNFFDGIFYGIVWNYNTCLYDMEFSRMFGYMEPELVYSYDGKDFLYTSGKPLIDRPLPPKPGCCGLSPQEICESKDGKEYYIYLTGTVNVHGDVAANTKYAKILGEKRISGSAIVYRIRKDGFCGIESVNAGGLVITKCISLIRPDLSFNLRANVGTARFGIMEKDGKYIEGFELDNCIPFEFDDSVDYHPQWRGHDLSEVLNKRIRIVVELNTAILHCISATARPHIRQAQISFSNPQAYKEMVQNK